MDFHGRCGEGAGEFAVLADRKVGVEQKVGRVPERHPGENDEPARHGVRQRASVESEQDLREGHQQDRDHQRDARTATGIPEESLELEFGGGDGGLEVIANGFAHLGNARGIAPGNLHDDAESRVFHFCQRGFGSQNVGHAVVETRADERTVFVIQQEFNGTHCHGQGGWLGRVLHMALGLIRGQPRVKYPGGMRTDLAGIIKIPVWAMLMALLPGCSGEHEKAVEAVPPVHVFELNPPASAAFRSFPGEVAAMANGRLSFDVSGRLIDFPVYDGKVVEAGALIGRLDASDFQAQFDTARARFIAARDEFARQTTLRDRRVIAQNEWDRQREAFEVAEAALRTAQKALEDTELFAPFKGRVAHRFVRNFQNVQARELVVLLQDVSTLKVDVQIPESSMSRVPRNATVEQVRPLLEAKAEFAAMPGQFFDLTLDSFSTRASTASRTFLVSFVFNPPEDSNILPGMTCNVFVRFREDGSAPPAAEAGFVVPVRAILAADGKSWVWKWNAADGSVARVSVELGGPVGDGILIRSPGLVSGDLLVASGVRFLSEGSRVRRLETLKP